MDKRQIVLLNESGTVIKVLDVSNVDHASAELAMELVVRTRCDHGDWHAEQRFPVAPWGSRLTQASVYDTGSTS